MATLAKVPLKVKRNGEWYTIGYTTATLINSQVSGVDTSSATAYAADVLSGKTAYARGSLITGEMTNHGAVNVTLGAAQTLGAGYYSSISIPAAPSGTDTSDADATANDILLNKTAYVNGSKVTGNIPSRTQNDITPGTSDITVSSGYYGSSFKVKGDNDLVAGNIKAGETIFGVTGTYTGSSSTSISMDDHSPNFDRGCTELNQGFIYSSYVFNTGSETYNGSSWGGVGNSNTGSKVNEIKYCKITNGNTSKVGVNTSFYKTQSYNHPYRYLFFKDATTLKADTNGLCLDRYSDGGTDLIMPVLLFSSNAYDSSTNKINETIKSQEQANIRSAIEASLDNPWGVQCDEKVIYGFPKKAGNSRMFITYSDLPTGDYYVVFCFPCIEGVSSDNALPISLIQEFNFLSWNFHGTAYTKTTHDASQG